MTENDLRKIEEHVGFALPASYRATLLDYPFEEDSFADECLLPNCPQQVIDMDDLEFSSPQIGKPFFFGSDCGEELFFLDAARPDSGVFVFELETGRHRPHSPDWQAFLDYIHATHGMIAAEEEAERLRKQNKKWWQFWI